MPYTTSSLRPASNIQFYKSNITFICPNNCQSLTQGEKLALNKLFQINATHVLVFKHPESNLSVSRQL